MAALEIDAVLGFVDEHQEGYIDRLAELVAIKSVSTSREHRSDVIRSIKWMKTKLEGYGANCILKDVGHETLPDWSRIPLPPVLLGSLGEDATKKTVLIYGHLDVQPALKEDGWTTDPFVLTEKHGNLYGRGATDNKGPVLAWLNAIDAYKGTETPLPVNLKFLFEGMEECGSKGLDELLRTMKRNDFFSKVDVVCICDNYWLTAEKPCLTYGLRGLSYFGVEVECAEKDLHSGVFGGTVHEAMNDLVWVLAQLMDVNNKILIPGVMDDVAALPTDEQKHYENINFDLNAYRKDIGCQKLIHDGKKGECLTSKWMLPSLSIHGIEGAFHGAGAKTVIPRKVIGKFSIRLVAKQDPLKISKVVIEYLEELWERRKSPNKFRAFVYSEGRSWASSRTHPIFQAGVRATKKVHGIEPEFTREGGTIPITQTLEEVTGKSVIVLPIGQADDGAHSENEKISRRNYIGGIKVLAAYLYEVAKVGEVQKQ